MKKRVVAFVLMMLMLVTMVPVTAMATNQLSGFSTVTLTGNTANDIVNFALAQEEKTGKQLGATEEWCADFVFSCARSVGIGTDIIPSTGGVKSMYDKMISAGAKIVTVPQKGDLVFFNPENNQHVAIMINESTAIHGNAYVNGAKNFFESSVFKCTYRGWDKNATYVFVRPNYCDHSTSKTDWKETGYCTICKSFMPNKNDNASVKTGIYKVISNNAYLREAPYLSAQESNGFDTVPVLPKGTTGINVTGGVINGFDNLWYKVTYNGKTGYIVAGNLELDSIGSKPAKPANMTVTSYENSAYISWSAVSGATSYEVQFFSNKRGEWMSDASCYHGGTSYTSTGLEQDSYKFRVRAVNVYGVSDWAEGIYTKPSSSNPTTPTAPKNLTATYISDTQATISWSAVSGAASYEAQYYKITDKTYVTDTSYASPKTATSYKSSGLNTHNCFRFRVRAVGSSGVTSSWSEVVYVKPGKSHSYGSWVTTVAATHTASGSRYRICSECGYKQEETIPAIGHSYGTAWKTDATYHWHTCSCGAISSTAAHDFGSWVTSTAATHTANGSRYRTCNICGYKETQTISAIGHNYGTAWKSNATNHWHECSCGDKSSTETHSFGSWQTIMEATHTTDGLSKRVCTVCGWEETEIIPTTKFAPGDVNDDGIITQPDLIILSRHVAKIQEITDEEILTAADYNRDGTVNAADLTALARYIKTQEVA